MITTRRSLLTAGLSGALALSLPARQLLAKSWRGYERSIVIDGLGGLGSSASTPGALTEAELEDARESGITCVNLTLGPVGTTAPDTAFTELVQEISQCERRLERSARSLARIRTVEDIHAAKKTRRVGLIYGVQDGVAFETNLDRLDDLFGMGLRIVQPTYNRRNLLGDGCLEPANAGLSITGTQAVERMNALGILIDLSHCGRQTAADAIRISRQPVAFTHTGCAALAEHPRNRTDAELRAVADKGGVSGIYFMPYLCGGRQPASADIIRHVEHMIDVAGEDHVSIGTDGGISAEVVDDAFRKKFAENTRQRREAGIAAPQELEDGYLFANDLNTPRRLETFADMLSVRGHSDSRIEKILGANLLRVFAAAWKA